MATRKTASKISSKASLSIDIDEKSTGRAGKKITKKVKKLSPAVLLVVVIMMAIGAVGGYFGLSFVTKNDCFDIIGKDEITLTIGEKYADQGCKVIAFGKDDSGMLKTETNLTIDDNGEYYALQEGTYYITYTVDNLKYGSLFKIQKIRLISFVEPTEPDEIESANK